MYYVPNVASSLATAVAGKTAAVSGKTAAAVGNTAAAVVGSTVAAAAPRAVRPGAGHNQARRNQGLGAD